MNFKPPFLYIDPSVANYKKLTDDFNEDIKSGKHIFLFLFMDGCGPCNQTKEGWKNINKFAKKEHLNPGKIVIAEINQKLFKDLQNVGKEPMGYPCLRYIKSGTIEEYEDSKISKKDRTAESFADWIDSKLKGRVNNKHTKRGGKWSLKYKRSINCRRPKGFSQRAHCKSKRRTMKRK